MSGVILRGATVVELDPPAVEGRDLMVSGSELAATAPAGATIFDAGGCVILPGLVLAHTHLYSALARGMPPPAQAPRSFLEILERVWWRLDRALDEASLAASAEVALLEAALCGATTIVDHHESPSFIDGSLDVIAAAAERIGVRAVLCYGSTDRHGAEGERRGLRENQRFIAKAAASTAAGGPKLGALVGLHAGFTASDEMIAAAADLARRSSTGVHLHLAEDPIDQEIARQRGGKDAVERLERGGVLNPNALLAHAIHLSERERAAVRAAGATVAHNPRSNLNNAVGYLDVRAHAPNVALGTDGIDGDLWVEARAAFLRGREAYGPLGSADVLSMLVAGHGLARRCLGGRFGALRPGAPADLVVLSYDPPTPLSADNLVGHLLFGMGSRQVRDVMVAGEWIVRDRSSTRVESGAVQARGREQALRLWRAMA
ncbi:MAG TPA: amidohydrolase family protein [Acidobacteriota bacterium]